MKLNSDINNLEKEKALLSQESMSKEDKADLIMKFEIEKINKDWKHEIEILKL